MIVVLQNLSFNLYVEHAIFFLQSFCVGALPLRISPRPLRGPCGRLGQQALAAGLAGEDAELDADALRALGAEARAELGDCHWVRARARSTCVAARG